jgi:hypothetical protein
MNTCTHFFYTTVHSNPICCSCYIKIMLHWNSQINVNTWMPLYYSIHNGATSTLTDLFYFLCKNNITLLPVCCCYVPILGFHVLQVLGALGNPKVVWHIHRVPITWVNMFLHIYYNAKFLGCVQILCISKGHKFSIKSGSPQISYQNIKETYANIPVLKRFTPMVKKIATKNCCKITCICHFVPLFSWSNLPQTMYEQPVRHDYMSRTITALIIIIIIIIIIILLLLLLL